MTTLTDRPNTALLVIDVQNGVVAGAHDRDAVVANIAGLVDRARAEQVPVVWVQHAPTSCPRAATAGDTSPSSRRPGRAAGRRSATATPSRTPTSRPCSPSAGSAG